MATYVLIHGAADSGWFWHLVEAELRDRGHDVVAPDLPCDDDSAGLAEYTVTVVEAIGDRTDLVVVAQSFGAFTAPLVCDRVPVDLLVLVAGMVPAPGERPDNWPANTGFAEARREQDKRDGRAPDDEIALFFHDVPPDLAAEAMRRARHQSDTPRERP
jgi:pimeloyl-ACP methyl ester carboxylesterase